MGRAELLFARPICASVGGMTQTLDARLNTYSSAVLSIFRIVFGFLFAVHGASKLFAWPVDTGRGAVPIGTWPTWWAGLIELVTGLLILVGLFTRIAAFIASGHMAVAYFWQHQPKALHPLENGGEPAVLFCFAFLLLVFLGPGALALDTRRRGAVGVSRTSRWRR
jgi:putative oxidoreductase